MESTIERLRKECKRLIEKVGEERLINKVREANDHYTTSKGYFEYRNVLREKGSVDATQRLIDTLRSIKLPPKKTRGKLLKNQKLVSNP
ncbi:hypothetical protein GCM10027275_50170 [Rhabdobacter roseus]|uniref:Uncharacterized membrane protein YgaE (UPF0421/DUF939 family) n=1 Tax=Rhabdobacter roseus TaxID=1655419 RepID=A0A840U5J1_9BACT|nr:hypothetical protein [Rhabdobacter roseus]MBB5287089.1 uncharacterized membrane protein YgaE (UPF0421/DUF939 family) [Rhabdobacter roseus]